ncbi:MAG TPA: 1,2-phenylacetyl-CoA epoxidase subunit PaaD [Candidatus Lustribacter sp.]|nr:1,2-phenylacetyl-CoA epoxidase subunit PaaD [Candidatus Lustribacter sp.]
MSSDVARIASADELAAAVAAIPDPEVPVLTIADLGILREVRIDGLEAFVTITPTYSGCPAMTAIAQHIAHVCDQHGYAGYLTTRLDPAWTTDWMSEDGRAKLARYGIAPPHVLAGPPGGSPAGAVPVELGRRTVTCPQCGSGNTTEIAHFGSTACKALRRCEECREPFDEFKAI